MYDPKHGRWLQRDPAGERTIIFKGIIISPLQYRDGLNLYEYVQSKPIIMKDPMGLMADTRDPKKSACEDAIKEQLSGNHPVVQKLHLCATRKGCLKNIECVCCPSKNLGIYRSNKAKIEICYNNTTPTFTRTVLMHELIHAIRICKKDPPNDCAKCIFEEWIAYVGSGQCSPPYGSSAVCEGKAIDSCNAIGACFMGLLPVIHEYWKVLCPKNKCPDPGDVLDKYIWDDYEEGCGEWFTR
jgi:RHS repeat-associated protein